MGLAWALQAWHAWCALADGDMADGDSLAAWAGSDAEHAAWGQGAGQGSCSPWTHPGGHESPPGPPRKWRVQIAFGLLTLRSGPWHWRPTPTAAETFFTALVTAALRPENQPVDWARPDPPVSSAPLPAILPSLLPFLRSRCPL